MAFLSISWSQGIANGENPFHDIERYNASSEPGCWSIYLNQNFNDKIQKMPLSLGTKKAAERNAGEIEMYNLMVEQRFVV